MAAAAAPEILIIDEPTNYLDRDTMEVWGVALVGWGGTLLVPAHDRWLIDHWEGPRLRLAGAADGSRPVG